MKNLQPIAPSKLWKSHFHLVSLFVREDNVIADEIWDR